MGALCCWEGSRHPFSPRGGVAAVFFEEAESRFQKRTSSLQKVSESQGFLMYIERNGVTRAHMVKRKPGGCVCGKGSCWPQFSHLKQDS